MFASARTYRAYYYRRYRSVRLFLKIIHFRTHRFDITFLQTVTGRSVDKRPPISAFARGFFCLLSSLRAPPLFSIDALFSLSLIPFSFLIDSANAAFGILAARFGQRSDERSRPGNPY